MSKFKVAKAVVSISGDYCAFHEASVTCDYVFGYGETGYSESVSDYFIDNVGEYAPKYKDEEDYDVLYEVYEKTPIEVLDGIAKKLYGGNDNYSGYSDYKIMNILIELDDKGKIKDTYMSI